jgi:hypothetical protein
VNSGERGCVGRRFGRTSAVEVLGAHQHASMSAVDAHLPLVAAWFGTRGGFGTEEERV